MGDKDDTNFTVKIRAYLIVSRSPGVAEREALHLRLGKALSWVLGNQKLSRLFHTQCPTPTPALAFASVDSTIAPSVSRPRPEQRTCRARRLGFGPWGLTALRATTAAVRSGDVEGLVLEGGWGGTLACTHCPTGCPGPRGAALSQHSAQTQSPFPSRPAPRAWSQGRGTACLI